MPSLLCRQSRHMEHFSQQSMSAMAQYHSSSAFGNCSAEISRHLRHRVHSTHDALRSSSSASLSKSLSSAAASPSPSAALRFFDTGALLHSSSKSRQHVHGVRLCAAYSALHTSSPQARGNRIAANIMVASSFFAHVTLALQRGHLPFTHRLHMNNAQLQLRESTSPTSTRSHCMHDTISFFV